jgi:hypothetical protein
LFYSRFRLSIVFRSGGGMSVGMRYCHAHRHLCCCSTLLIPTYRFHGAWSREVASSSRMSAARPCGITRSRPRAGGPARRPLHSRFTHRYTRGTVSSRCLHRAASPACSSNGGLVNAFTTDVEDYFHATALSCTMSRGSWPRCEYRVEANTERLLRLLEQEARHAFAIIRISRAASSD